MEEQILAVQRMQDYIAAHLEETVTLADLAQAARFSPWHAHRLFRRETGLSPAEYIRRLRLSQSARLLKQRACTVTDAALSLGFGSVDGYQRAFRREFGLNPGAYARGPQPIPLFIAYGVQAREYGARKEREPMDSVQTVIVQKIRKPERRVILRRGIQAHSYFSYCAEVGCDVWGLLTSMDSLCGEPVCLWLPEKYRAPGTSVYVQGVEVALNAPATVPEGFDVIRLPEAEYLQFQGEPFPEEEFGAAIGRVQQAMDAFDPTRMGYAWDDENPRIQLEPRGERGYIELRAIRKNG